MRLLARLLEPHATVYAHCDLPCGVYNPAQARIEAESVKAISQKYNDSTDPAFQTRALMIKEQRSDLVKQHLWVLWTDYFKPNHFEKYPQLHDLFNRAGLDGNHVQWVWAVNYVDVGGFSAEQFFPGADAVDWVAVDGYNWGASQSWSSWATPSQVFGNMVGRLAQYAKPLSISEVASTTSTTSGTSVAAKSQWVSDFFAYATNTANARMVAWFNADKETDWAVFGGGNGDGTFRYGNTTYRTYAAYKAAVQPLASSSGSGRLLTDSQFAGT